MKHINYFIALVLSASTVMSSCSKHEMHKFSLPVKTIQFHTDLMDTKSAVDTDGKIHFTETELFTPFVWSEGTSSNLAKQLNILRGENGKVSVTHSVTDADSYNYGFVSPASNNLAFDGTNYTVTLPTIQQPASDGSTFDPKADVLISELVNVNADATGEATARFKRMFTFLKVTVPASRTDFNYSYSTERLIGFKVRALDNTALSGTAIVPATNNYDECIATFTNGADYVEATLNEELDFTEDRVIWFVVNPAKFTGLELTLHTQARTYTRTFESFECEFKPGTVNTLTFKHNRDNNDPLTEVKSTIINGVRYEHTSNVNVKAEATENYGLGSLSKNSDLNVLVLNKKSASYDFELSNQGLTKDVIYIGNTNEIDANEKVCLKITKRNQLRNPDGIIAFKNLKLDLMSLTTDAFRLVTNGNDIGGIRELIIEDCDIYMSQPSFMTIYGSPEDCGVENIVVRNSKIIYTPSQTSEGTYAAVEFFNLNNSNPILTQEGADKFKSILFENNVIHWTNATDLDTMYGFSIIYATREDAVFSNLNVKVTNNSFVEAFGVSGRALITFANTTKQSVRSILFDKNIIYSSRTAGYPTALAIKYNADNNWYNYSLNSASNYSQGYAGVKLYYEPSDNKWAYPTENKGATFTKKGNILPNLANGSYAVNPNYVGYGSSLE